MLINDHLFQKTFLLKSKSKYCLVAFIRKLVKITKVVAMFLDLKCCKENKLIFKQNKTNAFTFKNS